MIKKKRKEKENIIDACTVANPVVKLFTILC